MPHLPEGDGIDDEDRTVHRHHDDELQPNLAHLHQQKPGHLCEANDQKERKRCFKNISQMTEFPQKLNLLVT